MSTELIQAKLGMDTSQFSAGANEVVNKSGWLTKKVNEDGEKSASGFKLVKGPLGQVNEALSSVGLSALGVAALFGKLIKDVLEFGAKAKYSANDSERAFSEVANTITGTGNAWDSIVKSTVRGLGSLSESGRDFGNWLVKIGEGLGIASKGAYEAALAEDESKKNAALWHGELLKVADQQAKIYAIKQRMAEAEQAALPLSEQVAALDAKRLEIEEKLSDASLDIVAKKNLEVAQLENMEKLTKARGDLDKKNAEESASTQKILADAVQKDNDARKAAADEISRKKRLSNDDELEFFRLSSKNIDTLTREEKQRLEVLTLQKQQKAIQVEMDVLLSKGIDKLTPKEKERLTQLDLSEKKVEQELEKRTKSVEVTQDQADASKRVATAEDEVNKKLEDQIKKRQTSVAIDRKGDIGNLSDYRLQDLINTLSRNLQDAQYRAWSQGRGEDDTGVMVLRSEIAAAEKEMENRREEARIAAAEAKWEAKHNTSTKDQVDKTNDLLSRVLAENQRLTLMFQNEGMSTVKKSDGGS